MIKRTIINKLNIWALKKNRKPLVLRGARQVGKTTAVEMFSKTFEHYIYLNLELKEDKSFFEADISFEDMLNAIFVSRKVPANAKKILIFIDEIQNSAKAVAGLRYFYEKTPFYFVIAAGSLLDSLLIKHISFPVGRVEYMVMWPVSFIEYINAANSQLAEFLDVIQVPDYVHETLLTQFNRYALVGGMPEAVSAYLQTNEIIAVNEIYENLILSYLDDVEKYAPNDTMARVIRYIISTAFIYAGSRIKFEGFGKSPYKSREIGEAFRILEKAFLLHLLYPVTQEILPVIPDIKKSPKLQMLDTGLVNYKAGIQKDLIMAGDINSVFQGKIVEHIIGQELLAYFGTPLSSLNFWVREKSQSSAEIDFIFAYEGYIIPIEVKSTPEGRLRSLHSFIDNTPHPYAIRIYPGKLKVEKQNTLNGKNYYLLNLPFYLVSKLDKYIDWFVTETSKL